MTKTFNKKTGAFGVLSAVLLLAVIMPSMPFASAVNDLNCIGFVSGGEYDNVKVEKGESCILSGVTVNGNVQANESVLVVISASTVVSGDVQANESGTVLVQASTISGDVIVIESDRAVVLESTISGDVQIQKTSVNAAVRGSSIGGNLQMEESTGLFAQVLTNEVSGNIQYYKNTTENRSSITNNVVVGNLQCFENTPTPANVGNTAASKEGQCA